MSCSTPVRSGPIVASARAGFGGSRLGRAHGVLAAVGLPGADEALLDEVLRGLQDRLVDRARDPTEVAPGLLCGDVVVGVELADRELRLIAHQGDRPDAPGRHRPGAPPASIRRTRSLVLSLLTARSHQPQDFA